MNVDYLEISGGKPLRGEICVQGSKNAVLPILSACLLGEGVCEIENCPLIRDVEDTLEIMQTLGCTIQRNGHTVIVDASGTDTYEIKTKEAARIRSSVLFLGALLGKMKKAVIPRPGGCAIGKRPVDLHLSVLEALGAEISVGETIKAYTSGLKGSTFTLPFPSVGATENAVLAAVAAQGQTVIRNAAREPEIDELCEFLRKRGACIIRKTDGSLCIEGGHALKRAVYRVRADRIVSGTYLLAGAATGGAVTLLGESGETLKSLLELLGCMGASCSRSEDALTVQGKDLEAVPYVETAPYPGFPTDLQSPLIAALCRVFGKSCVFERIFENRFCTVPELLKFGADISVHGRCAQVTGVHTLHAASVKAPDLRGGAALVVAALQAQGRSKVGGLDYIGRGYEDICRDLTLLGAQIRLVRE